MPIVSVVLLYIPYDLNVQYIYIYIISIVIRLIPPHEMILLVQMLHIVFMLSCKE